MKRLGADRYAKSKWKAPAWSRSLPTARPPAGHGNPETKLRRYG